MLKAKYTKDTIYFVGDSMEESLMSSEALLATGLESYTHYYEVLDKGKVLNRSNKVSELNWHSMITKNDLPFEETNINRTLNRWGLTVDNIETFEPVLKQKRNKYHRDGISLHDFRSEQVYDIAHNHVRDVYGGTLSDGTAFFDYQFEGATYIAAKKRLLLAFDMGLGKTRTTLIGLTSNPANRKILIVTMSRNIADWIKEMKLLGLDNDYIHLKNRNDMKSDKRIHLVSYEKWAHESILFKDKLHEECPSCEHAFQWHANLQYCGGCEESFVPSEECYSEKDLPGCCPSCQKEWKKGKLFCACGFTVVKTRKKPLYKFFNRTYDAAAIDEAQYIKNGTTKRSRSILAIKTKTRVALTGTPAENGTDDLYWILTWLYGDSHQFEDAYEKAIFQGYGKKGEEHFRSIYGGAAKTAVMDSKAIDARVSNHEKLWHLLDMFMFRKLKTDDDVKSDIQIPEPVHRRLHVALEDSERAVYDKRLEEFKEWYQLEHAKKEAALHRGDTYRISTIVVCSWLDKLRKVASCPWAQPDFDSTLSIEEPAKLRVVKEKIKEFSRVGKKMLIFTAHKQTAEDLGVLLDSVVPNVRAAYIHGEVPMSYRHELMANFQDPNHPLSVLVMTMRTGAESYTLTEAKAVVLYDLDFNSKKIEQCYSRAVRLGQKDTVEILWLIGVDTIDANMHSLVLSKKSGVDLAIDRKALDFDEIAKEFESDGHLGEDVGVDYQAFATDMLSRGNKREDYAS